jgi:hypothetical protein
LPCVQQKKMGSLMCSFAPKRLPGLAYETIMNVKETTCYLCVRPPVTHVSGPYIFCFGVKHFSWLQFTS